MALVKATIQAALVGLYTQMENTEFTKEQMAAEMATIIDDYIKTADVKLDSVQVNLGIPVTVVPVSGVGATTGPGTLLNTGTIE